MESINLLERANNEDIDNVRKIKESPYFIIIEKAENKKMKIPCANEAIAKKLLASYTNNNSNCKAFFV